MLKRNNRVVLYQFLFINLWYLMVHYLSFKLFFKKNIRLINESNALSRLNLEFIFDNEKICKNVIYVKKKLTKSFKINFGL